MILFVIPNAMAQPQPTPTPIPDSNPPIIREENTIDNQPSTGDPVTQSNEQTAGNDLSQAPPFIVQENTQSAEKEKDDLLFGPTDDITDDIMANDDECEINQEKVLELNVMCNAPVLSLDPDTGGQDNDATNEPLQYIPPDPDFGADDSTIDSLNAGSDPDVDMDIDMDTENTNEGTGSDPVIRDEPTTQHEPEPQPEH